MCACFVYNNYSSSNISMKPYMGNLFHSYKFCTGAKMGIYVFMLRSVCLASWFDSFAVHLNNHFSASGDHLKVQCTGNISVTFFSLSLSNSLSLKVFFPFSLFFMNIGVKVTLPNNLFYWSLSVSFFFTFLWEFVVVFCWKVKNILF